MHPLLAREQVQRPVADPAGVQYRAKQIPTEEHPLVPRQRQVRFGKTAHAEHRQPDTPEQEIRRTPHSITLKDVHGKDKHYNCRNEWQKLIKGHITTSKKK